MIGQCWGIFHVVATRIFCVAVAQDPAAAESQQLLDSMREGFAARGAGWLREELAKQTAAQLRQLAGTAGVQQREAGRKMSKAELLEKVAQHISEKQARVHGFARASPCSVGLRVLWGMPAPTTPLPQMACGSWQRR